MYSVPNNFLKNMAELIRINENSGIWHIKPRRQRKLSKEIVCALETEGYYGNARGHFQGNYLEGDIIFEVDEKYYDCTDINTSEGVNLGTLEWGVDLFKNINWKLGPIRCSLKGYRLYLIKKKYDSLLDPNCNLYYDFTENDRKLATTKIDFHSFFRISNPPPRFEVFTRNVEDPNSWLIALISLYIHSIDRHYQAKPM